MLHALMPRGLEIVERLLPGYCHELQAAGAVPVRIPTDSLILTPAGWLAPTVRRMAFVVGQSAAVRVGRAPAAAGPAGCDDPRPPRCVLAAHRT